MSVFSSIKDHILIGGPNAVSGWGLLTLLAIQGGLTGGVLRSDVSLPIYLAVVGAALLTGNGVYVLNAYYDAKADKINKPNRPIPSGRMTPQHALKYAWSLMALGLAVSLAISVIYMNPTMLYLWSVFTLLGIAYSMPPVKLKARHILGNLCFGIFAGLSFNMYTIYRQIPLDPSWWLWTILIAVCVGGLITMKDLHDVDGDMENGDITLPVKVGRKKATTISIGIMGLYLIVYYVLSRPINLVSWLIDQWVLWIIIGSFAVYIVLDYVGREHIESTTYARVIYYFVIISAAYGFVKGALLPWKQYPILEAFIRKVPTNPLAPIDRFVVLAIYVVVSAVAILQTRKMGRDILKPRVKGA